MARDHTATLRAGDPAPDFTLESSQGPITLSEWLRAGPCLLVFTRGTF